MDGFVAVALAAAAADVSLAAAPPPIETVDQALCRLIDTSARQFGLPVEFLTRLIWRESSFRTSVVSRAGAQGVAQFMPGTAAERGLRDPFDPGQAIPEAARLLADLATRFGNLGLAAAAYNGGPVRVDAWLAGRGGLPAETRAYVAAITRRSVDEWATRRLAAKSETAGKGPTPVGSSPAGSSRADSPDTRGPDAVPSETCVAVVAAIRRGAPSQAALPPLLEPGSMSGPFAPWGVQIAGNFSKSAALAGYRRAVVRYPAIFVDAKPMVIGTKLGFRGARPFWRVRIGAPTRAAADALCVRLQKAGGSCLVLRS